MDYAMDPRTAHLRSAFGRGFARFAESEHHDGGHSHGRGGRGHGGAERRAYHRGWRGGGPGFGPGFGGFGPGFPFGPGGHRGGRRGSRAARGDIRLAALGLLAEQPMHGYQLMREIATRSEGAWRASPGAVYPALQQLEDEGLIEPQPGAGKRVFTVTEQGREYVEEHRDEIDGVWRSAAEGVDESWLALADTGRQVMQAFGQVVSAGNRQQVAAATKLMADTRRQLYRILAEDESDEPADSGPAEEAQND